VDAGAQLRDARRRRGWSLRDLAARAGMSASAIQAIEAGRPGTPESYARLGAALGLRPSLTFPAGHDRVSRPTLGRSEDFVHGAMGEALARVLARPGRGIGLDEPYQHYQFAGRADVAAWDIADRALLHVENRTRFANLQEAAGAYNAKRQYLARALADRLRVGPRGWRSVTHVLACLWSSEVLHVLRLRGATFAALAPDPSDGFAAWLAGESPPDGVTSCLVLLDPAVPFGSRKRGYVPLADAGRVRPRYRGYADAAEALRRG
jgi:transcriptional regulator with XRE-family HTH domain